jgi:hypothetical protein
MLIDSAGALGGNSAIRVMLSAKTSLASDSFQVSDRRSGFASILTPGAAIAIISPL